MSMEVQLAGVTNPGLKTAKALQKMDVHELKLSENLINALKDKDLCILWFQI